MGNLVYIATSLDGFIASEDGGIDWLHEVPNPSGSDFGYSDFMKGVDAIVMGRNTYEKVLSFPEWPFSKKVFVLSKSLTQVRLDLEKSVEIVRGHVREVLERINSQGYKNLYIDGGKTVQECLQAGLIDELTISRIPILLGKGIPLFGELSKVQKLKHLGTQVFDGGLVKSHYAIMK